MGFEGFLGWPWGPPTRFTRSELISNNKPMVLELFGFPGQAKKKNLAPRAPQGSSGLPRASPGLPRAPRGSPGLPRVPQGSPRLCFQRPLRDLGEPMDFCFQRPLGGRRLQLDWYHPRLQLDWYHPLRIGVGLVPS